MKIEYTETSDGEKSLISLTRRPVGSTDVLQKWNILASYKIVDWDMDKFEVEAIRTEAGQKPWKVTLKNALTKSSIVIIIHQC